MRLVVLLLVFSLFLSGYCAAAHAFGDIPMQAKAENTMADMDCCPDMQSDKADNGDTHHPAKTASMNCKACCMSLVGFPPFVTAQNIGAESLKFSAINNAAHDDISFLIFHPPKSPA